MVMERFAEKIIRLRWAIIAVVFIVTILLGYQIQYLSINSDIFDSLPDDDPDASLYKNIGDEFGGNNVAMIVLETENIYTPEVLQHIKQITDSLRITEGVESVTSLTNIIDITSSDWGIEIGKLIDEYNLPQTKEQLDSLQNYINSKDLYKGLIVSDDGTSTIIIASLFQDVDNQKVAEEIKRKIKGLNLPEILHFGGIPMTLNDVTDLIIADIVWLIPLVFIVIALILFFSFRSVRGIILPLLTTGIAIIWTMGILSLTGYELSIISNIIPVVLLAIGSAYTIHVLNSINLHHSKEFYPSLKKAIAYITIPVVLASVTTAVGFMSFVFGAYLSMIRDFGIFTATGTIIALILSIVFVPAFVAVFSSKEKFNNKNKLTQKSLITIFVLTPLIKLLKKHPRYILYSWIAVIIISIGGSFLIDISVNIIDYFKKNNPTRVAENILQSKFGGSSPVFVVFEGDIQSPEVLQKMSETEKFMKQNPYVSVAQSVADLVEQMNDAMGEGKKIPDDKAKIEQLWFLLEGQDIMPQLVSDDLDKGIIQSKFASTKSDDIKIFLSEMQKYIDSIQSDDCKISLTGMPSVYLKINDSLIKSQFSSLIIAVVLVFIIVGLLLKSAKKGFIATIPIIATVMLLFGFMGFSGIPLDIATALVGSIVLGVGVDYSIHIISGFNHYMKETDNDVLSSIEKTLLVSGKAVVINVISVTMGFIMLIFSQLIPLQHFGILIAICMIGSGIGSLTLVPVMLLLTNKNKNNVNF